MREVAAPPLESEFTMGTTFPFRGSYFLESFFSLWARFWKSSSECIKTSPSSSSSPQVRNGTLSPFFSEVFLDMYP